MDVNPSGQSKGHDLNGPGTESFDAFVVRSRFDLFRTLAAHFHHDVATEALADAYAYTWKHWDSLSRIENPTGYVYRIAERLGMRTEIRNRKLFSTEQLCELSDSDQGVPASGNPTGTRWMEACESDSSVVEILRLLPSRQRACVLLIHAYGWSYKQAALTLDLPITTVTNEATRGLARLRNQRSQPNKTRSKQGPEGPATTEQSNGLDRDPLPKRKSRRS